MGVSIYACYTQGATSVPAGYVPGQTVIAQEASHTKDPPAQDQFPDVTQNTSIEHTQTFEHVQITQEAVQITQEKA